MSQQQPENQFQLLKSLLCKVIFDQFDIDQKDEDEEKTSKKQNIYA